MINPKANSMQPTALTQYRFNYFFSFIMHVITVQWNVKKNKSWWNVFWSFGRWLCVKLKGTPWIHWFLKVLFSRQHVRGAKDKGGLFTTLCTDVPRCSHCSLPDCFTVCFDLSLIFLLVLSYLLLLARDLWSAWFLGWFFGHLFYLSSNPSIWQSFNVFKYM